MIPTRILAPLIFLACLLSCQSPPHRLKNIVAYSPAPSAAPEESIIRELGFSPENIGYLVMDNDHKKIIASYNVRQAFLPASLMKIPTALMALSTLGPRHRFDTSLAFTGEKKGAEWKGTLYLKGTGDPLLTLSDLMNFVYQLRKQGVTRVTGRFVFDDSFLPHAEQIDEAQEVDGPYNTSVSALSVEFNRVGLRWSPAQQDTIAAQFVPPVPWLRLALSEEAIAVPHERFGFRKSENEDHWLAPPDIEEKGHQELPVKDGGLFSARLFSLLCENAGISIPAPERGILPKTLRPFYVHKSLPLAILTEKMLEHSNNLMAELLFLSAIGRLKETSAGTFWKKQLPNIRWNDYVAPNGSGLSLKARITPEQMIGFLSWASARNFDGQSFLTQLPVAAWKGTLRERLIDPNSSLRVWAKTGSMKYASNLAGYFFSRQGRQFLFALFILDPQRRKEADSGLPLKEEHSNGWTKQSQELQEKLLAKWIHEN